MGCDGGFTYIKVKDFKNDWKQIKNNLISYTIPYSYYEYVPLIHYKDTIENYPEDIQNLSNKDLILLLQPFSCCDCPCIINDDLLIFGYGDNVAEEMSILRDCLSGELCKSVETWT